MSKVLMIRHLPLGLTFRDKEQLLKHFGANKVWEQSSKRNYVFASFDSVEKARISLGRLHQLEIGQRRLVVEYSFEKETVSQQSKVDSEQVSTTTKLVKEFLRVLNSWNPSVDFYQPPPPNLKYKYPDISTDTVINIVHALFTHKPFYIQALHLMNKMCLASPFQADDVAITFFKDTFKQYFIDEIPEPHSEIESELSSDETTDRTKQVPVIVKRKRKLPIPSRKRAVPTPTAPKVKKIVNQEDVFETVTVQEPKKIAVVVHQDALQKPIEEPEVIGELGKFEKEEKPKDNEETKPETQLPTITRKEIQQNRISYRDMKILPVFKNYHPGEPSMRLYIKNLAKTVIVQDVERIYRHYVEGMTDDELTGFDVRVMQEGRMKGQAFVTFPSVKIAEKALHETNGYMLKEKPMVVQFARAANKKNY